MKIFSILLALALAFPAWADELEHFPGWKINKIEQAVAEDGSYSTGPEYYGLTPPDERPAISIDARTARLLKAGEAQPEEVYGRNGPKKEKAENGTGDEDYVYGAGNNGFVQADEIASTLPGYVPEVAAGSAIHRKGQNSFAPGSAASYGGSGTSSASVAGAYAGSSAAAVAGGSFSAGSSYGSNGSPGSGNSYEGGSPSAAPASYAGASNSASAQAKAQESAKAKARGVASNSAGSQNPFISGGLNVASGPDSVGTTGGKSKWGVADPGKRTDKWGVADEDTTPPPCPKGRFVYDKPTLVRLKLPIGCGYIHITTWGAGGGSGKQRYQQGREGRERVREISGGGGSFMSTSWEIDARKYDLVVVVGEAGGEAGSSTARVPDDSGEHSSGQTTPVLTFTSGAGGFPEGKDGVGAGSGGGGGYSGVFLSAKSDGSKTLNKSRAMAVAAGGSGGSGGAGGGSFPVPSTAPDARMTNQIGEKAKGSKAGYHYYPGRGGAGSPGNHGKVILEYY